ncbi:MAG: SurA N-terminal domain-containing protein [Bacteroidales bacterium]|nr:SurA N-terminal domain-containing protein [Bacteroidales bacterium]MBR4479147.1 SurA N-terminal domain-containing protein [Bacteroidales bacterium]
MAVLQTLRTKFGLAISIIVALGLLSFIIDPGQIESAVRSMSSKYDVGKINGKSVSYTDFQEDIERFTRLNELMTGTSASSEEEQTQIRDAAWQSLVDKFLFVKEAKDAGITVGEAEMLDLTTGANPSPIIAQNAMFLDGNGNFSPDMVVDFVRLVNTDDNYKLYWNYLQNSVYTQQFYQKYGALFNASSYQNPLMLRRAIAENNETTDVDFVMVPLMYAVDSTIVVSDDEIKNYYNSHKDFFRQNASRDLEYVVFEVVPSADDIAAVADKMAEIHEEFATTDNMKNFLLKNSDRPLSTYWYKEGELGTINSDVDAFAFSGQEGASPVYTTGDTFYSVKVMDTAMVPDSAFVKHILLTGDNAAHLADSLVQVASQNDASFSNLVALYSADQSTAANGELGSIGWMTQTYMIPGFESVIEAPVGKPFVLNTVYGTHVVLVSEKSAPVLKKQVAILEKTAVPSNETYNGFYAKANKFATIAHTGKKGGSAEAYKAALDSLGVYSHPMNRVTEATSSYGAIDNAKELTRWAFDHKPGNVSDIITVNQNYFFIALLNGIHEEGYATVAEAATSIRDELYNTKLGEKKAQEVAEKIKGLTDLQSVADALDATISSQTGVTFATLGSSALDPKFVGALVNTPVGVLSGPVAGLIGVYVYEVKGHDTGAFYTEDDAARYEQQKNQYNSQMLMSVMMDDAEVKDNRARFF